MKGLLKSAETGGGDLFVLGRFHSGDADGADALALVQDGQTALNRDAAGKGDDGRAILDHVLESFRGDARGGGRPGFASGDGGALLGRTVQTLEVKQKAAIVDDGDGDRPVIFLRFDFLAAATILETSLAVRQFFLRMCASR